MKRLLWLSKLAKKNRDVNAFVEIRGGIKRVDSKRREIQAATIRRSSRPTYLVHICSILESRAAKRRAGHAYKASKGKHTG